MGVAAVPRDGNKGCRGKKRDVYLCANQRDLEAEHGRDMCNENVHLKHHKRTQNVLPTNVHMYVQCAIVYSPNKHTQSGFLFKKC